MCFDLSTNIFGNISHSKEKLDEVFSLMYIGYSYHISRKLAFSRHVFETYSRIKFKENPYSGSRVVPCGHTKGQTDMTKLIVALRSLASANKSECGSLVRWWIDGPIGAGLMLNGCIVRFVRIIAKSDY